MSRLAYDLESLASPVIAAGLLTVITYNSLFVGTALGFVLSGLLVTATVLPAVRSAERSGPLMRRITDGSRIMLAHRTLRSLLALNMVVACASAIVLVNTVVYVHDLLDGSGAGVAVALACFGAGSMAAAICVPPLLNRLSVRRVMLCGAAILPFGLTVTGVMLLSSPPPTVGWAVLAAVWVMLGIGTSLVNTPSARLIRDGSTEQNWSRCSQPSSRCPTRVSC